MEYFSPFKTITFDNKTITNITSRINILRNVKDNLSIFQYYTIKSKERPEDIAYKLYKDSNLFWIILLMNDIDDVYMGWPLEDDDLLIFMEEKYGLNHIYDTHHYETTEDSDLGSGVVVNIGTPFCTPVSNYEYETKLNENKRKIKLLKPIYIQQVLSQVRAAY